jgi:hypothetical protein
MSEKIRAWHFLGKTRRLAYGDGRLVEVGVPLECGKFLKLGTNGMHASAWITDAIMHAPGPVLCLVDVWGGIREGDDNLCGRHREAVEMHDVTQELHLLACAVATFALENELSCGRYVDPRSFAAIEAKRGWLAGTVSDDGLKAAEAAAWSDEMAKWAAGAAEAASRTGSIVATVAAMARAAWAAGAGARAVFEGFALDIVGAKFEHIDDEVTSRRRGNRPGTTVTGLGSVRCS